MKLASGLWRVWSRVIVAERTLRLVRLGGRPDGKGHCRRRQAEGLCPATVDGGIETVADHRPAVARRSPGSSHCACGGEARPGTLVCFLSGRGKEGLTA